MTKKHFIALATPTVRIAHRTLSYLILILIEIAILAYIVLFS